MKKFLSMALALVMTLSLAVVGASATDYDKLGDKDQIEHSEAVSVMNKLGIITGYTDGTFKPAASITRGAAAKIVCYAKLGATLASELSSETAPFKDVSVTNVFAPYITYCTNLKIVDGYADKTFRPSTNLTGYAFTKMLLNALGITGTYTGNGWEVNVATAAQKADLLNGIDTTKVVMSKDLSRDNACQMALNAMKYTATSTVYTIFDKDGKATAYTFDNQKDALLYCAVLAGSEKGYEVKAVKDYSDSLLKTVFKVTCKTDDTDAYGRPATTYTADDATWTLSFPETPILHYTTAVSPATVKADAEKLGYTVSSATVLRNNGDVNTISDFTTTTAEGGNGTLIEVYANASTKTVNKIIVVASYLATVTKKDATTLTVSATGANEKAFDVTASDKVPGFDEVYAAAVASATSDVQALVVPKGDNKASNAALSLALPKTVTGKLTKIVGTGDSAVLTVAGKDYKVSDTAKDIPTTVKNAKDGDLYYLDNYGYVIGTTAATADTTVNYAVVLRTGTATDDWGESTFKAELFLTDGTTKTVTTNELVANKDYAGKLVSYAPDADHAGDYTLNKTTGITEANNGALEVTTGASKFTAGDVPYYANAKTIFVVGTNASYKVYTGFSAVPSYKAEKTTGAVVADDTSKVASVVFLQDPTPASVETTDQYFYAGGAQKVVDSTGTYYTATVLVNGEPKTYDFGADPKVGLYTTMTVADDRATLSDAVTETVTKIAPAANGVIKVGDGYFSYTSDCAVYLYDSTTGAITTTNVVGITTAVAATVNDGYYVTNTAGAITALYLKTA